MSQPFNVSVRSNLFAISITTGLLMLLVLVLLGILVAPWSSVTLLVFLGCLLLTVLIVVRFDVIEKNVSLLQALYLLMPYLVSCQASFLSFLPIRLYLLIMGLAVLYAIQKVSCNFKLYIRDPLFLGLTAFFILNLVYSVFYHSNFRSSSAIDTWLQSTFRHTQATMGITTSRQFNDSQTPFIVYLTGLIPLLTYLLFGTLNTQGTVQSLAERVKTLRATNILFSLLALSSLVGLASGMIPIAYHSGRLWLGGGSTDIALFFLFSGLGVLVYFKPGYLSPSEKGMLFFNLFYLIVLTLLGVKKGSYLAMVFGLSLFLFCLNNPQPKLFSFVSVFKKYALHLMLGVWMLVVFLNLSPLDSSHSVMALVSDRFADNTTYEIRKLNWEAYNQYWQSALTGFTLLFGFGTDASREAAFHISATQGLTVLHIHNLFMEVFYNYGLCGVLYFLPFIFAAFSSVYSLFFCHAPCIESRVMAATTLALCGCLMLFYTSETNSLTSSVTMFSLISLIGLQAVRFS
jgi:hypothetical protein